MGCLVPRFFELAEASVCNQDWTLDLMSWSYQDLPDSLHAPVYISTPSDVQHAPEHFALIFSGKALGLSIPGTLWQTCG